MNALTRIPGIKVIARTSSFAFKGKNVDVRTIGRQLGVNTILEGSVRKWKNRVRVSAQLVSTTDGLHLWSKNFDRDFEDIFALQDEISLLIADQIRENYGHLLIPAFPHSTPTQNTDAYDCVLKGKYFLKRKDFADIKKAVDFFQEATQLDPGYSEAFSLLGEAYIHAAGFGMLSNREAHELARTASEKSVSLNATNALGYKVLAYINLFYDWNWNAALQEYDKAIKYGLTDQNEFITYYYVFIKEDFARAIEVARKLLETDPLHAITHWQLGLIYYFARRFEDAVAAFSSALKIDPNFGEALRFRGLVQGYLGHYKGALLDLNTALTISKGQGLANQDMLVVKMLMGKKEEVLALLKDTEFIDSSDPAYLYALLNMPEEAIFWLEKAFEERSVMMVTLKNFWVWDNLRDHVRFKELYDRMCFPPSIDNKPALDNVSGEQAATTNLPRLSAQELEHCLYQLNRLMVEEQIFTDPALSLRLLAEKIDLHPNKLSWVINEHIGKNFNEYINAFRLEVFKKKAVSPNNRHVTLLGLAYESGFNSKTVFNSFFKKKEGMTPRSWVKQFL